MTERIVVYASRSGLTALPRSIEKGTPLPPNYYFTEEEAIAAAKARIEAVEADRKAVEPLAQAKFNRLSAEFSIFVNQLQEKYNAEIYADGTASDDTGIETWLEVTITQKGTYTHQFTYQLD